MGLSLLGSVVWLFGVVGSLLWPAAIAVVFLRWRRPSRIRNSRFLLYALPLSYLVFFLAHAVLADSVLIGAERAAATGHMSLAWSRLILVLLTETLLAVAALYGLQGVLRRHGRGP